MKRCSCSRRPPASSTTGDVSGRSGARVDAVLPMCEDRTWQTVRADARDGAPFLFDRVSLNLGGEPGPDLPTDERIARFAEHAAIRDLAALYYQFGRYLLIASSRPGTEPANLQGIWNDTSNPWWDSKYTVNINLPMNYWPAETREPCRRWWSRCELVARGRRDRARAVARRALGRARLGAAPEHRSVARDDAHGRPVVGHLADRRRLAMTQPVGALPLRRRRGLPGARSTR